MNDLKAEALRDVVEEMSRLTAGSLDEVGSSRELRRRRFQKALIDSRYIPGTTLAPAPNNDPRPGWFGLVRRSDGRVTIMDYKHGEAV